MVAARLSKDLLITGGQQRQPASLRELGDTWYGYGRAVIASVDTQRQSTIAHSYVSGTDVRNEDDPMLFKCATKIGQELFCTTETEVLHYKLPDFTLVNRISHPWFNDVHHVIQTPQDTLLVASSGIDAVLEMSHQGSLISQYPLDDERKKTVEDCGQDLRFGLNLKPHKIHPNHLFEIDGEPWVTRFECRDAVSLVDPNRTIEIGRERVHDGHTHDGQVWFTTVDGGVIVADATTLQIVDEYELHADRQNVIPGWCRGLLVCDDYFWVGFSRIRKTTARERLGWIRSGLSKSLPTRIECWNRRTRTIEDTIELEAVGVDAVFTILER